MATLIHSNVADLRPTALVQLAAKPEVHTTEFASNGDPVLSPSQLSTYMMCPRKWAARYLHGQHEPVGEGTHAGKRMHTKLERYYDFSLSPAPINERSILQPDGRYWTWTGVIPGDTTPEGKWAMALIAKTCLPAPAPGVLAERRFKFEYDGVWWRGSKDLTYRRDGVRIIRDHKSTSQLNPEWVKSEDELTRDPQSVIYALEEYLSGLSDQSFVRNEWGYVTRNHHPQTELHGVDMPWDATRRAMDVLTAHAREMLRWYRERPGLNELGAGGIETGGCTAYGGCKVIGCNVTALDRIKGQQVFEAKKRAKPKKEEKKMGYLDQFKANKALGAASAPSTPPPAAAPTPAPAPPATTAAAVPLRLATEVAPPTTEVAPPPFRNDISTQTAMAHEQAAAADAPKRGRQRTRPAPVPGVAAPAAAEVSTNPGQPEAPAAVASPAPVARVEQQPTFNPHRGIVAAPGASTIMFSQYVAIVHQALKEAKQWDHYALHSFEGKAAYQDCLQQVLQVQPPHGYLVVYSNTDEGRDALDVLTRFAGGTYTLCINCAPQVDGIIRGF